jgi:hypothetical protein
MALNCVKLATNEDSDSAANKTISNLEDVNSSMAHTSCGSKKAVVAGLTNVPALTDDGPQQGTRDTNPRAASKLAADLHKSDNEDSLRSLNGSLKNGSSSWSSLRNLDPAAVKQVCDLGMGQVYNNADSFERGDFSSYFTPGQRQIIMSGGPNSYLNRHLDPERWLFQRWTENPPRTAQGRRVDSTGKLSN